MMDVVLQSINFVISTLCIVLIGEWTFHWMVKDKKKYLVVGILYVMTLLICAVGYTSIWSFPLYYIVQVWMLLYLCELNGKSKLLRIISLTFISGFVEATFQFLFGLFLQVPLGQLERLLCALLTLLFFVCVCRSKFYGEFAGALGNLSDRKYLLLLVLVILSMFVMSLGQEVTGRFENDRILNLFRILAVADLFIVAGVVILFAYENNRKLQLEELLKLRQDFCDTLYEKDQEMRSFRHDTANHLGMLYLLLEQEKVEEAKEHLGRLTGELEKATLKKIHMGDDLLDALLTLMAQKAQAQGITLEISGVLESTCRLQAYELCTILFNAIQNAIEACRLAGGAKKVTVKVLSHQNTLYVTVINPATEEMYRLIQNERTGKEDPDNHGFGVRKIKSTVKRLNGTVDYNYEDGKVILEICL